LLNTRIGTSQEGVRDTKRHSGDFNGTNTMKPTDYDLVKLALNSVDLVILRLLVQQEIKCKPDADRQRLDLLTRARDLLAEFYLASDDGNRRQSLASRETPIGPNQLAKPLRAYGDYSDHLSRITPRRRSLSGRTK
jgi:hypothetical protein